jgi:small conductance mechanosensitive channel
VRRSSARPQGAPRDDCLQPRIGFCQPEESGWTRPAARRNDIVVGISYADDVGKAIDTIQSVRSADSRVLADPEPLVAVAEMADSSVNLVVRPWCNSGDYWPLRFDLMRALKEQVEAAGCSIPYPQTDVHLHQQTGS